MPLEADAIQGVLFLSPGQQQADAQEIWSNLFPSQGPDSFHSVSTSPALNSFASGPYNGHRLTVNVQVGLVAVALNPNMPEMISAPGMSRIADVDTSVHTIAHLLKKLRHGRSITRCALVLNLATTVGAEEQESAMRSALPGFPFPDGATDIVAQFNLRRPFSHNPSLQMNRLCTWNSGQAGFVQLQGAPGQQIPFMNSMITSFVGLKIDVNTAPEGQLDSEDFEQVISDLASEAIEIYRQGMKRF